MILAISTQKRGGNTKLAKKTKRKNKTFDWPHCKLRASHPQLKSTHKNKNVLEGPKIVTISEDATGVQRKQRAKAHNPTSAYIGTEKATVHNGKIDAEYQESPNQCSTRKPKPSNLRNSPHANASGRHFLEARPRNHKIVGSNRRRRTLPLRGYYWLGMRLLGSCKSNSSNNHKRIIEHLH